MEAHVRNHSTNQVFLFDWAMHVDNKNKFTTDLSGEVEGPRAMPLADLKLHSNITFSSGEDNHDHVSYCCYFSSRCYCVTL